VFQLSDGCLLYHGSYVSIPDIDLTRCHTGLDFGNGFYVTSSFEQARNYIPLSVSKAKRVKMIPDGYSVDDGQISVYEFHYDPNLLIHYFQEANAEWLHFVAANRSAVLFDELLRKFRTADIIVGKIANDQTARTLQQYIAEYFGTPGTREADEAAIRQLLPNRLQDQFCFRTEDAIKCLRFVRSERYGNIDR
jgi:hypothetical protein